MLAGAWGHRAGELLEQAAGSRNTPIHVIDGLTMLRTPDLTDDRWCAWLFGAPEDRGGLASRFASGTQDGLPAAFGRALIELGTTACELLCGRFVVVALDRERRLCHVVRDQLGAQPVIHVQTADGVLFAEHERDLLELLARTPDPDRLALLQWIGNGLTPPGRTLYEGLRRLPAGHRLGLETSRVTVERWWNLRFEETDETNRALLAERLRETAFAAVRRSVSGAGRPAVKLSGGLDSACVAAGLRASGFAEGRAIAIGGTFAAHSVTDESDLIEATARHTHLPLELIAFNPESSILVPALEHIASWRLPPATPNLFLWQPLMARAHALGVDLLLDGEGGDELFGLSPYLIADMLRGGQLRTAWSLAARIPGVGPDAGIRARLSELRHYGLRPLVPQSLRHRRARSRGSVSSRSIIPPVEAQALAELYSSNQENRDGPRWWRSLAESLIDTRDLLDLGGHFRRAAADSAMERRHPFLYDLRLIEGILRIPPQVQFDPVRDRPLLRDALKGLIPEVVRTRHVKSHFTPLVLAGLRADESGLVEPLRQPDAPVRAYVAQKALDRKLAVAVDERPMIGAASLWRVAIANRWLLAQHGQDT